MNILIRNNSRRTFSKVFFFFLRCLHNSMAFIYVLKELLESRSRHESLLVELDSGRRREFESKLAETMQQLRKDHESQVHQYKEEIDRTFSSKVLPLNLVSICTTSPSCFCQAATHCSRSLEILANSAQRCCDFWNLPTVGRIKEYHIVLPISFFWYWLFFLFCIPVAECPAGCIGKQQCCISHQRRTGNHQAQSGEPQLPAPAVPERCKARKHERIGSSRCL